MATSPVRLDTRAFFWRVAILFFIGRQILFWVMIPLRRRRFVHRVLVLIFHPHGTQRSLYFAALAAGGLTVLAELAVFLLIRPLVARWYSPVVDDSEMSFRLESGERVVASTPARLSRGRSWAPGSLILTNRRLRFFPAAWDSESVSFDLGSITSVQLEPAPRIGWGMLADVPEKVAVYTGGEDPTHFAVAEPGAVLRWFGPKQESATPNAVDFELI